MRKTRVLLADDHPGLLQAVRSLLNTDVDVVGCVDNGESLFDAAMKLQPDVLVTDISMPKRNARSPSRDCNIYCERATF